MIPLANSTETFCLFSFLALVKNPARCKLIRYRSNRADGDRSRFKLRMIIVAGESSIEASISCTRLSLRGAAILLSFSFLLGKTEELARLFDSRERSILPKGDTTLSAVCSPKVLTPKREELELFVVCSADFTGCPLSVYRWKR